MDNNDNHTGWCNRHTPRYPIPNLADLERSSMVDTVKPELSPEEILDLAQPLPEVESKEYPLASEEGPLLPLNTWRKATQKAPETKEHRKTKKKMTRASQRRNRE